MEKPAAERPPGLVRRPGPLQELRPFRVFGKVVKSSQAYRSLRRGRDWNEALTVCGEEYKDPEPRRLGTDLDPPLQNAPSQHEFEAPGPAK